MPGGRRSTTRSEQQRPLPGFESNLEIGTPKLNPELETVETSRSATSGEINPKYIAQLYDKISKEEPFSFGVALPVREKLKAKPNQEELIYEISDEILHFFSKIVFFNFLICGPREKLKLNLLGIVKQFFGEYQGNDKKIPIDEQGEVDTWFFTKQLARQRHQMIEVNPHKIKNLSLPKIPPESIVALIPPSLDIYRDIVQKVIDRSLSQLNKYLYWIELEDLEMREELNNNVIPKLITGLIQYAIRMIEIYLSLKNLIPIDIQETNGERIFGMLVDQSIIINFQSFELIDPVVMQPIEINLKQKKNPNQFRLACRKQFTVDEIEEIKDGEGVRIKKTPKVNIQLRGHIDSAIFTYQDGQIEGRIIDHKFNFVSNETQRLNAFTQRLILSVLIYQRKIVEKNHGSIVEFNIDMFSKDIKNIFLYQTSYFISNPEHGLVEILPEIGQDEYDMYLKKLCNSAFDAIFATPEES